MPRAAKTITPSASQPSDIELQYLKSKIDRVLLFLDSSAMPPEVKTAWVTLLPHMTLAQVDRLTALLEEEFTLTLKTAKEHPEDEEFILKLQAAKERYDATVVGADQKALAALARIEAQLPSP